MRGLLLGRSRITKCSATEPANSLRHRSLCELQRVPVYDPRRLSSPSCDRWLSIDPQDSSTAWQRPRGDRWQSRQVVSYRTNEIAPCLARTSVRKSIEMEMGPAESVGFSNWKTATCRRRCPPSIDQPDCLSPSIHLAALFPPFA